MSTLDKYKKPYLILFNSITDTIKNLENTIIELDMQDTILKVLENEIKTLKSAQANAEEAFISI